MEFLARYDLPVHLAMAAVPAPTATGPCRPVLGRPLPAEPATAYGVDFSVTDEIALSMGFER